MSKNFLAILFAVMIAFALVACGNDDEGSTSSDMSANFAAIEITSPPTKTAYLMGEIFDPAGLVVSYVYDDDSKEEATEYTITGNTFKEGTIIFTVAAKRNSAKTANFEITVSDTLMPTGLPVLYIDTAIPITSINREDWANMPGFRIVSDNPAHSTVTGLNHERDQIRGRGNNTWTLPKKPWRVRFRNNVSLFGLTAARNWVLLANYRDATLLTGTLAFELGQRFGDGPLFKSNYVHVEVVFNGEYQGSFLLTEHMRVAAGRVDIDPLTDWLVELDVYYDEDPRFRTPKLNLPVMIKSPDLGEDVNAAGYKFVVDSVNALDAALADENFPNNNWKDLVNIDSFVDYIMLNEIAKNLELSHPKSVFMCSIDGKIQMSHLWDFDWAFGLEGLSTATRSASVRYQGGWFFERLFKDPAFASKYKARWNEKYAAIADIVNFVDTMYEQLKVSAALNSRRWPMQYSWQNHEPDDYAYGIGKMRTWLSTRIAFLNTEINK